MEVFATGAVPCMPVSNKVNTSAAEAVSAGQLTLDFQLKKGIWAEGRVYDPDTIEPFQGELSYFWICNRDLGRMSVYSRGFGETDLAKYRNPDGSFPYYDTVPYYLMPGNYNRLALVEPKIFANERASYALSSKDK